MKTDSLRLPLVRHPDTKRLLYPHQAIILDKWEMNSSFLLTAKTGTGKTLAAVLPILLAIRRDDPCWKWAMAVYPTNELVRDQAQAIVAMAEQEGLKPALLVPDQELSPRDDANLLIVPIDARMLDRWQKKRQLRRRSDALRWLLEADKPKIVLANPDILFLILSLRYHADPLAALQAYTTLIIDEFHLYQGIELAHALFMVHLARQLGMFRKVLLLSATPAPEVGELLKKVLAPCIVDLTTPTERPFVANRTAVHEVEIIPVLAGIDVVEKAYEQICAIRDDIRSRRRANLSPEYLPGVVILNSVVNAIRLEDKLVKEGVFDQEDLLIVRGLSNRKVRSRTPAKLLAIGTSAIEVGIDFRADVLVFEASEAPTFLQRFGRIGRHSLGKAFVLCPSSVLAGMETLPGRVDRGSFEEKIYHWYPQSQVHSWFVTTEGGMITIRAQANGILRKVQQDSKATAETIDRIREKIEHVLEIYTDLLRCEALNRKARRYFTRAEQGDQSWSWLTTYEKLNTFRTSLPSIPVFDWGELSRHRNDYEMARYEADLKTLLHRAREIEWNAKLRGTDGDPGMITVKGYGKYQDVWVSEQFSEEDCGVILETTDPEYQSLLLFQAGKATPLADVMQRQPHIFTVVPKSAVASEIDWRLPVFESGKYLVAFDGAALLLWELRERKRNSTS